MTRKEEVYARQFYQELKKKFRGKQNSISKLLGLQKNESKSCIDIELEEAGTQSNCTIRKEQRQCFIHFFDIDRNDLKYKGPEFYTIFKLDGKLS